MHCPRVFTGVGYALDSQGDTKRLLRLAWRHRDTYKHASPYKHIVIDNFVKPSFLEEVSKEIRASEDNSTIWRSWVEKTSIKSATRLTQTQFSEIGPATQKLFDFLQSAVFIKFLEVLTGIENILSDQLVTGAGVSKITSGGYLDIHADFNQEPGKTLGWRRLNLLLYLNEDWEESFGGSLEMWETNMAHNFFKYYAKVLPSFNRVIIFSTTDVSLHGHMDEIQDGRSRFTVSTYYYTNERQDELISAKYHSTIYPDWFLNKHSSTRWAETRPICPILL